MLVDLFWFNFSHCWWTVVLATGLYLVVRFVHCVVVNHHLYRNIPSTNTSLVLGTFLGHLELYWLLNTKLSATVLVADVATGITKMCHLQNDGLLHFRIGPFRNMIAFLRAKETEVLLSHPRNITKAREYDFLKPWLGEGLLTGGGNHWRQHRKLLTPTFHFEILHKFLPIMNRQLRTLLETIEYGRKDDEKMVVVADIRPLVTNCTVDVICETAMGIKVNAQNHWLNYGSHQQDPNYKTSAELRYVQAVRGMFDMTLKRLLTPWYYPDWLFRCTADGRLFRNHVRTMHAFTIDVIERRKKELVNTYDRNLSLNESIQQMYTKRKRLAFLDLLLMYHLQDPTQFDLVSIREEVDTFMFGGHDTTSTTLHFALLLIGLNQDKQDLIHDELEQIFGTDSERGITEDDLKQMVYVEMCIKETLRLYPPAAFFARKITEPFKCGKYWIPAGCTALVLSHAVHHDPSVYKQADHFIPERFRIDEPQIRNPFAFIPFSAGIRNCIGQKFAMLELKLFVAAILRHYRIRSLTNRESVEVDFSIISKANSPISIEFERKK